MEEEAALSFEEIEHTADLCLRAYGQDMAELFVHAAQGMFHLMQCEASVGASPVRHAVVLDSYDLESLLVDWLGEVLYLAELHQACYTAFEISRLEPTHLEAVVHGMTNHPPMQGIKAVTFSDLGVVRDATGRLQATVTFDV